MSHGQWEGSLKNKLKKHLFWTHFSGSLRHSASSCSGLPEVYFWSDLRRCEGSSVIIFTTTWKTIRTDKNKIRTELETWLHREALTRTESALVPVVKSALVPPEVRPSAEHWLIILHIVVISLDFVRAELYLALPEVSFGEELNWQRALDASMLAHFAAHFAAHGFVFAALFLCEPGGNDRLMGFLKTLWKK